jgi:hypothetical protein
MLFMALDQIFIRLCGIKAGTNNVAAGKRALKHL